MVTAFIILAEAPRVGDAGEHWAILEGAARLRRRGVSID